METLVIFAFVAASLLALVVLGELVARFCLQHFGGYYPFVPHLRRHFELDLESLPTLEPIVRWEVNSDGERGQEYEAGKTRILIAGGSCVEGYYLDQASSVGVQLEALLNERWPSERPNAAGQRGAKVHVGCIGRSKVSTEQVQRILEQAMPRYERLDCIVLMVGLSDVLRWLDIGMPTEPWTDPVTPTHLFGQHPEGPYGWTVGKSALRAVAVRWNRKLRRPKEIRRGVGKRLVEQRAERNASEPKLEEAPGFELVLNRFSQSLERLIECAKTKTDLVVVARQPWLNAELGPEAERQFWNYKAAPKHKEEPAQFLSRALINELLGRIERCAGATAERTGVVSLELLSKIPSDLEHYYDEAHFTPLGAKRVAALLADAVLRQSYRAGTQSGA